MAKFLFELSNDNSISHITVEDKNRTLAMINLLYDYPDYYIKFLEEING